MSKDGQAALHWHRRKRAGIFCFGLLAALLIGWPAIDAVCTLGWPMAVADAEAPWDKVISELIHRDGDYSSRLILTPDVMDVTNNCENRADRFAFETLEKGNNKDSSAINLLSSAHHERNYTEILAVESVQRESMVHLPRPLLAALRGCVEASIASIWCDAYASNQFKRATEAKKTELRNEFRKIRTRYEPLFCRAISGLSEHVVSR